MILIVYGQITSFVHFSVEDFSSLDCVSLVKVEPILSSEFLDSWVVLIKFGEGEILIRVVLFPCFRDFSSSPHENTVNFVVSFLSVDTIDSKAVFSEMLVKISDVSVLQVASQITNNSFSFVFNVVNFPERPSLVIEFRPELVKSGSFVG